MIKGSSANGLPRARSAKIVDAVVVVEVADIETEGRKAANYYPITIAILLLNACICPLATV